MKKDRALGEKGNYKYLGILEANTIKQTEMKIKIRKEYLKRTRKCLEIKLCVENLIKRINTWAVPLVRYSGPFLEWTRKELKKMNQRTRKLIIMHKGLHPRNDIDRFYESRKEELEGYIKKEQRKTNQSQPIRPMATELQIE